MTAKQNELSNFMFQLTHEMASEYARIYARTKEDPGTAGDQGEENWAQILRDWLPQSLHVVTKGRILARDGTASPQIDILVLSEDYPRKLLNKKLYLSGGVVAAFECKTTLRAEHIREAVETCKIVKDMLPQRKGTPYRELFKPMIYGLLAHSHGWKGANSTPIENVSNKLMADDSEIACHPYQQIDLVCVADLATWKRSISVFSDDDLRQKQGFKNGQIGSTFMRYDVSDGRGNPNIYAPIAGLIYGLTAQLSRERASLRAISEYYAAANFIGRGGGMVRAFRCEDVYSDTVLEGLKAVDWHKPVPLDEWGYFLP